MQSDGSFSHFFYESLTYSEENTNLPVTGTMT